MFARYSSTRKPAGVPTPKRESLASLPGLELEPLIRIADAFALIRVRPPQTPHICCDLSNLLSVDSSHRNRGLVLRNGFVHSLDLDLDALRNRKLYDM